MARENPDRELDAEIEAHLEMEAEENRARGMSPEDARLAARRRFGAVALAKERCREVRAGASLAALRQDLAHGLRLMRRNPGSTAATLFSLALGIGAATSIFAVANALLFRPLPFRDSGRLVALWKERTGVNAPLRLSWVEMAEIRQAGLFEAIAGYSYDSQLATGGSGESVPATRVLVSAGFLDLLGRAPALGRIFAPEECYPVPGQTRAAPDPAILSYETWQTRYGARPDILGQIVSVDTDPHRIIGVMPKGFRLFRNDRPEVFLPIHPQPLHLTDRRTAYLEVIGRLRPGVPLERLQSEVAAWSRRAKTAFPATNAGVVYRAAGLHEHLFGSMRPLFVLVLGGVTLVVLIACANVAGLLLVRAIRREREFAIRRALGAGSLRLTGQLLTESLMLSIGGGALGLLLAVWAKGALTAFSAKAALGLPPIEVDGAVAAFALAVTIVTCALFGLAPAIHASRLRFAGWLQSAGRNASGGVPARRFSNALVICELAFSLVLLVATGLLLKSLVRLSQVSPGFQPERVLTMSIGEVQWGPDFVARAREFWPQLLRRLESLPGVEGAAVSHAFPMSAGHGAVNTRYPVTVAEPGDAERREFLVEYQDISPGYFRTLGIPLIRGRFFETRDMPVTGPEPDVPVAIVNQSFARRLWGGQDPIGKRIVTARTSYTVVGVVGDVKQYGPRQPAPPAQVYCPVWYPNFFKMGMHYLVVRTTADPASLAAALKSVVAAEDRERAVGLVRTMQQVALERTAWDRVAVLAATVFGGIAILLTVVGIYALLSQSVSRRIQEIGIRLALGGRPSQVFRMVLAQGVGLAVSGIAVGIAAALVLTRFLSRVLFEVSATDWVVFAAGSLLLAAVALAASWLPARAATRVDPISALRLE